MDLTVMGPGGLDTPGDMLEAPVLTQRTDKFAYRRNVRMWYECVQSAADSGYTRAKGTAQNLGHALFTRMDQRFQRIVTSAIDSGSLRLRMHADGTKFSDQDHIACVQKILNLVAKETTTDRVKRLIRMTKDVYDCKRGAKESFAEYSTRFESLARAYLSTARSQTDSQDEQNFAIMAVENANLPISTYNAIITNLVSHAKDNVKPQVVFVQTSIISEIFKDIQQLHTTAHASSADTDHQEDGPTADEARLNAIRTLTQNAFTHAQSVALPIAEDESTHQYAISLTRALEELQDVRTEEQRKSESTYGTADMIPPNTPSKGQGANSQVGALMSSSREGNKNDPSGQNNKQHRNTRYRRGRRRGGGGGRRSSSKGRLQHRHDDMDTDRDEDSSDDDWDDRRRDDRRRDDRRRDDSRRDVSRRDESRKRRRNVFDRLGNKTDETEKQQKKVRFDERHDRHDRSDSENDSYFRKGGRQGS